MLQLWIRNFCCHCDVHSLKTKIDCDNGSRSSNQAYSSEYNSSNIFGSHNPGKIVSVNKTSSNRTPYIEAKSRKLPNYFDVSYVFDGFWGKYYKEQLFSLRKKSGRLLELRTNAPSTQFYRANNLKGGKGKRGYVYNSLARLCLVTRGFPDAIPLHRWWLEQSLTHIPCCSSLRLLHSQVLRRLIKSLHYKIQVRINLKFVFI